MIRLQVSRMPDGGMFFCLARTIHKDSLGYHAQQPVQAIGLGCKVDDAKALVYADGIDLAGPAGIVPVGVTCRTCERPDCAQRAFPSLRQPLHIDENVRRLSLYSGG
jgi:predicted transcriptional regulator